MIVRTSGFRISNSWINIPSCWLDFNKFEARIKINLFKSMEIETQDRSHSTENDESIINSSLKEPLSSSEKTSKSLSIPKKEKSASEKGKRVRGSLESENLNANKCKVCRRKLKEDSQRCSDCQRGYHIGCLDKDKLHCEGPWLCLRCR